MELYQLRSFIEVAQTLHFSKAAKKLGLQQSTLSGHIQALEGVLGVKLLERNSKKVALTSIGKEFLKDAKEIIKKARAAEELFTLNNLIQTPKIGYTPLSMLTFLPKFITFLNKLGQEVELVEYRSNTSLINDLKLGSIDIAFHYPTDNIKKEENTIVHKDEIVLIQAINSPLANEKEIDYPHFKTFKYILPNREANPYLLDIFYERSRLLGFMPQVPFIINSHQARLVLVAEGHGVTLDSMSLNKLQIPGLVFSRIKAPYRVYATIHLSTGSNAYFQPFFNEVYNYFNTKLL